MSLLTKKGVYGELSRFFKKIAKEFSLQTLKGRTALLARFLVFLVVIGGVFFYWIINQQHDNIKKLNESYLQLNQQVGTLEALIQKTTDLQTNYLISGNLAFSEGRVNLWEGQINEIKRKLEGQNNIKSGLSNEIIYNIDTLVQLITRFELLQQEFDNSVEKYFREKRTFSFSASDSVNAIANLIELESINNKYDALKKRYEQTLPPVYDEIFTRLELVQSENFKATTATIDQFEQSVYHIRQWLWYYLAVIVVFGMVLTWFTLKKIDVAIKKPLKLLKQLTHGELPEKIEESKDELNVINQAVRKVTENLRKASDFARGIGGGNFESSYQPAGPNDALGNALVEMGKQLKDVAQKDKHNNWINTGQSKFADLLRQHSNDFEQMTRRVISELVKYLDANQGGLYIINNTNPDDQYLELMGSYAYGRQKHLSQKFKPGDGLIGQAFIEGNTMLLKRVPDNYITIKSGVGGANPTCVLIVPLAVNEQSHGVVELAAFEVFDDHKVRFVESLAESLASSISNARINERTKILLQESQEQAEEMRAQEEEMRQNMEELQATQEEIARKEMESRGVLDAINANQGYVELSPDREVLMANAKFADMVKYEAKELRGLDHITLLFEEDANSESYIQMWDNLRAGQLASGLFRRKASDDSEVFIQANYSPVKNQHGEVVKIVKVCIDVTETKQLEAEYKAFLSHVNRSAFVLTFDANRYIIDVNQRFLDLIQKEKHEVVGQLDDDFDSLAKNDPEKYKQLWDDLLQGKIRQKQTKTKDADGQEMWVEETYTPIIDEKGRVIRVLNVANDITDLKLNEQKQQELNNQLQAKQNEIENKLMQIESVKTEIEHRSHDISLMFEAISKGAMLTDETGALLFATNNMLELMQTNSDDILGLEMQDFFEGVDLNQKSGNVELTLTVEGVDRQKMTFEISQLDNGNIAWLLQ